ncbi:MAG: DUF1870 family protein [bacterium]|nr:DUF1870 family protein [bacterium]
MNGSTLKALRSLLFFTQEEASILIGGVSLRSWQYWEVDKRTIPQDVIDRVTSLILWRKKAIETVELALGDMLAHIPADQPVEPLTIIVYGSVEDWMTLPDREPVMWKPHCSAVANLCASFAARSIVFDAPAYARWLGKRKDNETMRGQWAASV